MKRFALIVATLFLGALMYSGVAAAADQTHYNNNSQQPRAYYGEMINNGAAVNSGSMSASEYRNYVQRDTAPNNYYGGGQVSNVPLSSQQPSSGVTTAPQPYGAQPRTYYGTQPRNYNNYVPNQNEMSQSQYRNYVQRETAPNNYYGGGQMSNIPLAAQKNIPPGTPQYGTEALPRAYYGAPIVNPVPNAKEMSAAEYKSYVQAQTAPGYYYGGGEMSNIPLSVQNATRGKKAPEQYAPPRAYYGAPAAPSAGIPLTMSDIYFSFGKATLKPGADQKLNELARVMKDHPDRHLVINGYTDNTGPADYNLKLSKERADAVRNFLTAKGISPDRIVTKGLGESYPVATNDTAVGRQLNRRVEIVIPNAGQPYQTSPGTAGAGS